MPLRAFEGTLDSLQLGSVSEQYLIFYSSVVDGVMWCPDCQAVESIVRQAFGDENSPSGLVVYTGDRAGWKSPLNILRKEPWQITDIPTIIRVKDGAKLVDKEIISGLSDFIKDC